MIVGYNDYESRYAGNIEHAMDVFRTAGVEHVLWATLHAIRQIAPRLVAATTLPLSIASQALPVARRGRAYATRLRAVGGVAPYRWTRIAGAVAPGLRLTAGGRLEGVPLRAGTFRLTARVVDRAGVARTRAFLLRIL